MLRKTFFALSLAPSAVAALGAGSPVRLPIQSRKQEQTEWCWATCMQMVITGSGKKVSQCDLANAAFGLNGCCANPSSNLCNQPLPVFSVAPEWLRARFLSKFVDGPVPFATVKDEIQNNNNPIEVGLKWTGSGGHAVLIVGFSDAGGQQDLVVLDPFEGEKPVTYDELSNAYGRGAWRWSWTGVRSDGTV